MGLDMQECFDCVFFSPSFFAKLLLYSVMHAYNSFFRAASKLVLRSGLDRSDDLE